MRRYETPKQSHYEGKVDEIITQLNESVMFSKIDTSIIN